MNLKIDRSDLDLLWRTISPLRLFKKFVVWFMGFYSEDDNFILLIIGLIIAVVTTVFPIIITKNFLFIFLFPVWFIGVTILVTAVVWLPVKAWEIMESTYDRWKNELEAEKNKAKSKRLD